MAEAEREKIKEVLKVSEKKLHQLTNELENRVEERTRELHTSEEQVRLLLNSTAEAIYGLDLDGRCTFCNPACLAILGYESENELLGNNMHDICHYQYADGSPYANIDCKIYQAFRQGQDTHVDDEVFWRCDGTSFSAEYWSHPIHLDGKVTGAVVTFLDISERKLTQEKLTEALADAHRAARLVKLGTWEWDSKQGRLVACSEEYARIHGMSIEEALQTFTSDEADYSYIHPADREGFLAIEAEALAKGEGFTAEYRMLLPSGRICHIHQICEVELNDEDEVIRTMGSLQDVTEQVQLEEQLRQGQKMEAVGQLAGGIAHDFNNLLTAINGYSDLLLEDIKPGDPWHHYLSEIKKAGDRAATLTRQLLAFGRKQILQPKVLILGEIAGKMESMLRRLIGEHIELHIRRNLDLQKIKADPGQMEQVIMNLVLNARDAMLRGGNITVSVESVELDDQACAALADLQAGEYVVLSVSDTGIGMNEETLSHIFEPFYTTKEVGKGSGLGLSTVFGIVKQSGGEIEVESEPGKGSTFRIYLPQVEASELVAEENASLSSLIEGGETILLVEDEDILRQLLKHILERLGYSVLAAQHGREALLIAETHEGMIDLMITDIVMPQMSGHELVQRLAPLRPEMPILYMSGYDEEILADQGLVDVENLFLKKPFSIKAVGRKIREILDQSETT